MIGGGAGRWGEVVKWRQNEGGWKRAASTRAKPWRFSQQTAMFVLERDQPWTALSKLYNELLQNGISMRVTLLSCSKVNGSQ